MRITLFSHSPASECGTYNPQSCLFSQICNVCSVLGNNPPAYLDTLGGGHMLQIDELLSQNIVYTAVLICHSMSSGCWSSPSFAPLSLCLCPSAVWIVVIRFQQVRDFGDHGTANILSIVWGFIACIGISVLGNFQVTASQNKWKWNYKKLLFFKPNICSVLTEVSSLSACTT